MDGYRRRGGSYDLTSRDGSRGGSRGGFRGGFRGGSHAGRPQGPSEPKICFSFVKNGTCKFGAGCRYSHDNARSPMGQPTEFEASNSGTRPRRQQNADDGKLTEWKRMLRQAKHTMLPSHGTIAGRFFQLGLELMDGDLGAAQEALRLLATEEGLGFIKNLTDRQVPRATSTVSSQALWTTDLRPFFKLITHPRAVDCASLEQEVAAIFNFVYGVGGTRMERVFKFVTQLLPTLPNEANERLLSSIDAIELSLDVLSKILDCNTMAIVDDKLSALTKILSAAVNGLSRGGQDFAHLQSTKFLEYIRLRLDAGAEIGALRDRPTAQVVRDQFVLRRDLPGRLSADGRRHDNDHADITKIQILPTYEEIFSPRSEYLPTTDSSQWHVPGIRGRLDREFRLLREDTVGQLRDAVKETLIAIAERQTGQASRGRNATRTYTYESPTPESINMDRFGGLELVVRCNQPSALKNLNLKKREDWWSHSKRLQKGALVCLVDATGAVLFCVVSASTLLSVASDKKRSRPSRNGNDSDQTVPETDPRTLSDNEDFFYVSLQLAEPTNPNLSQVLHWYWNVGSPPHRCLTEFPNVLLASFQPVLEALQEMYKKPNIPFRNLIAPPNTDEPLPDLDRPQYTLRAGFSFDLSCLLPENNRVRPLITTSRKPLDPRSIQSRTSLDPTQSVALLNTLSRGLSLIQGPPGTGKSYTGEKIIQVLLANKAKADLGPILCVCYTNHALDQLLEHLLDDGNTNVIRIGSQSKSERLQDLNLRNVAMAFDRTKGEKQNLYNLESDIRETIEEIDAALGRLSASDSWTSVKDFLAINFPKHHLELFPKSHDEDGFQLVNHHPERHLGNWLAMGHARATKGRPIQVLEQAPLSNMSHEERNVLCCHWLKSIRDSIIEEIVDLHEDYQKATEHRNRLRQEVDLRCLHQANIVGLTTTGLARNLTMLRKLRCKVMVCEEAGEVLEAHILTALLPSVEHAILIGDHLQLRPQINNYELQSTNPRGQQYSLDMSLFERLVEPRTDTESGIPFSKLATQRRMHPSIAELVRTTLYPSLKDGARVAEYPEVVGMKKRLFWLHHEHPEAGAAHNDPLGTSHSNEFEVEMTTALVSHLVRQGEYSRSDIAVITPYLGQLQRLRRRMESMFEICLNERDQQDVEELEGATEGLEASPRAQLAKTTLLKSIRIATVDNFQGEEAKVVVISLVRSNPNNNCGFLKTSNRINVLLSRAQHGMYIIGDANTYGHVPMWATVIKNLQAAGNFGTGLELQCARHPKTPLVVSQPDHFLRFSPESGCALPCEKRLSCGHFCRGRCHSDLLHDAVKCQEDCPRSKKGCDHSCPLRCGDICEDRCKKNLKKIHLTLPCGHVVTSAKCWEFQNPASILCRVKVTRTVPGCEHKADMECHKDVNNLICVARCGQLQKGCGHPCPKSCYQCNVRGEGVVIRTDHGICKVACGRLAACVRHPCQTACHGEGPCPPCTQPCDIRCSHSRCKKKCFEPCPPCAEQVCASRCAHSACTMPCAAPCDWVPCSKRCVEVMDCGHQCPSICGEQCPGANFCQQCGPDRIKSTCVDFLEMKEYHEIDLDEEPCIFPDCGHFLTVSSMDGQMDTRKHYTLDENGLPTAVSGASVPFSEASIRACPTCRGSLRNIARYGRIVRRGILDESTKRFISWSNQQYLVLAGQLSVEQGKLQEKAAPRSAPRPVIKSSGTPTKALSSQKPRPRNLLQLEQLSQDRARYATIIKLWRSISAFLAQVQAQEQPYRRVADHVQHANRAKSATDKREFQYDEESVIQVKGHLLASSLLLQCEAAILADFIYHLDGKAPDGLAGFGWSIYDAECRSFINSARKAKYPKEEVQGHILAAQVCLFARRLHMPEDTGEEGIGEDGNEASAESSQKKKEEPERRLAMALDHLSQASDLMEKFPSTEVLREEFRRVEIMANGGVFYSKMTNEEMAEIHKAMTSEFRGTGHWYNCANGHPFTIGECGMPMEMARCPECQAPIGGQNHTAVGGVERADDIERLGVGMERMGV